MAGDEGQTGEPREGVGAGPRQGIPEDYAVGRPAADKGLEKEEVVTEWVEVGFGQSHPVIGMFHGFLYREVGFGKSPRVRLRFLMVSYIESWNLASLSRLDSVFHGF